MAIRVTPIPSTVELADPAFTLGVANAAGDAVTAVASNSTLLTFDTSNPAAISTSPAVGSATVSARRDHGHAGIVAITSTDNAIARYNGTAGQVQNYTSLAPTISDAGIISLTSGALKWPATPIASADPNTLDDFEHGSWSPGLIDDDGDPTGKGQGYDARFGRYVIIGSQVVVTGRLFMSSLGSLDTGESAGISGLPFAAETASGYGTANVVRALQVSITAGNTVILHIDSGNNKMNLAVYSGATGAAAMTIAQVSADGLLDFAATYNI